MDSLITLATHRFSAGVCPQLGGALAWFGLADQASLDFVRPASARAWGEQNVRLTSCYPLVPYSNRIGDGRFLFQGTNYALRPNAANFTHPLHGVGWKRVWGVTAVAPQSVSLAITHFCRGRDDSEWPWTFTAGQTIALDDAGLRITLTLTNEDRRPMPAGIGLHPFFPKSPNMQLQFESAAVWINDSTMLPKTRVAVPPQWQFALRRPVAELAVDNCFVGWSRDALLYWPERRWGLHLAASEEFGHLVVYTSPARESIAIEPVSHASNAVNLAAARDDTGLVILAPGASLSGTFSMTPFPMENTDAA